jgi:L-asparagine oxygenase
MHVSGEDAARIFTEARALAAEAGASPPDTLTERAAALVPSLPAALTRNLRCYAATGAPHGTLLVRGLLAAAGDLEPTPETATPPPLATEGRAAELLLLAVMSLLGEPFTFASLYEGRLVQHVVAAPGHEADQTSEGSQAALAWHVEDAFTRERCDYFGLLCLRGAAGAVTRVSAARRLRLPGKVEQVLRESRFVVEPDIAHGTGPAAKLPRCPVLSGPPDDPEICFDVVYQRPADPLDDEAAEALRALAEAVDAAATGHMLTPGDLLVVDNRRDVHGRTGYPPRYDGIGRWVLRAMVCASGREHRRRRGVRVLPAARPGEGA